MKTFKLIKKLAFFTLLIIIISCNNQEEKDVNFRQEIESLTKANKILTTKLDSIINDYVTPFKQYEIIVLNEIKVNPDSTINNYNHLIKKYPNSFWSHEAKRRLENIQERKKFWNSQDGWKLNTIPKKPINGERTISCPGC